MEKRTAPGFASALVMLAASCSPDSAPPVTSPGGDGFPADAYELIDRVGFNAMPPHDIAAVSELLPFGWYKDFTALGRPVEAGGRRIDYTPILFYQSRVDTPEFLAQFASWVDQGLVPTIEGVTQDDYLDFLSLERLKKRIETRSADFPPGMLFQLGNEPGYISSTNPDDREPDQIVADALILRELLDGFGRDYRLALGGMSTPRYDFTREAYRGRYGFDFWEEILELAEPDLFDAYMIHPYPSSQTEPTVADLREQILEARRLLARFGLRGKELLVGETAPFPVAELESEKILRYTEEAIDFYLTARDPEIGHPGDGDRLVQRFCWFFLDATSMPERHGMDMRRVALLDSNGDLSELGLTFRDTVQSLLDSSD